VAKSVRLSLQVAILGVGAWLVIDGATTAGVMIAASIVMGRALAPVEAALGQWRGFVNARGAYHRLKGAFERPASSAERMSLPAPLGQLEVENVGLRHAEGEAPVLSGITFSIKAGETLGLIGPSGAGKSSLARLLVGISAPSLGSVRLDGAEVSSWPKTELGKYLGYLPQEIELLGGTIAQNICRFGSAEPSDIVAAATLAGAHEMILRLPQGYETMVENGGGNISGGQRQRLGLARALFGDTRLVVLDEPNANLDADGEAALRRVLSVLKARNQTVIVISHKPLLLSAADKLMVLNQGRVTLFGPAGSVMGEMAARAGQTGAGLNKVTPLSKRRPRSSSVEVDDAKASLNA
jgi:PrtD family type I secretion system ABC transporter